MITNIFATLYYGGLIIGKGGAYSDWASKGMPIAMALSHGYRVMIQLPQGGGNQFWNWIRTCTSYLANTRMAATHGIELQPDPSQAVCFGCIRHMTEGRKDLKNGTHYGARVRAHRSTRMPFEANDFREGPRRRRIELGHAGDFAAKHVGSSGLPPIPSNTLPAVPHSPAPNKPLPPLLGVNVGTARHPTNRRCLRFRRRFRRREFQHEASAMSRSSFRNTNRILFFSAGLE